MKNQSFQINEKPDLSKRQFNKEDFSDIDLVVDEILASIKDPKTISKRAKRTIPKKKWNRNRKKKNIEIGIRELPFTF